MSVMMLGFLLMLAGLVLAIVTVSTNELNFEHDFDAEDEQKMDPAWRALVIAFAISLSGFVLLTISSVHVIILWLLR